MQGALRVQAGFCTVGRQGRGALAGERKGPRGGSGWPCLPSIAGLVHVAEAAAPEQLERAERAPPQPGEERERGGRRRAGGAGYVNDTSPVRGRLAGATGGGGTARGGGARNERAGVGGGRGPGAK